MTAAIYILLVHSATAIALIATGGALVGIGAIGQDTLLAMVSGAVGLLSGGGTALALQHSLANGQKP